MVLRHSTENCFKPSIDFYFCTNTNRKQSIFLQNPRKSSHVLFSVLTFKINQCKTPRCFAQVSAESLCVAAFFITDKCIRNVVSRKQKLLSSSFETFYLAKCGSIALSMPDYHQPSAHLTLKTILVLQWNPFLMRAVISSNMISLSA